MTFTPHAADDLAWRIGPPVGRSLVLLLHGVGSSGRDLLPVAEALGAGDSTRVCVVMDGPQPFAGGGTGRQWFSVEGITTENRAERVMASLPSLVGRMDAIQDAEGLPAERVTLLGFSQGAILTLGLAASGHKFDRGVAFSGRHAGFVRQATSGSPRLWLGHGAADPVIPISESRLARQRFNDAGFDVQLMEVEDLGHSIGATELQAVIRWLAAA